MACVRKLLPIWLGLNLLFLLSEGESGEAIKKEGFVARLTPTTSWGCKSVKAASPISCSAIRFLKLFPYRENKYLIVFKSKYVLENPKYLINFSFYNFY